ncbi:hypothetical protein CEP51_015859 [Fusarium floridanum]|uniref:RING-type domain-containing protein n=1 Tax=Fusarium floridanum TaxID=1325733 RepID=A0A428P1I1_9HYPO|nr:hypothetical protein CEP51_015859 [Fusarium floridanum]
MAAESTDNSGRSSVGVVTGGKWVRVPFFYGRRNRTGVSGKLPQLSIQLGYTQYLLTTSILLCTLPDVTYTPSVQVTPIIPCQHKPARPVYPLETRTDRHMNQLQCQDLTLLEQSRKGKQRLGETTDSDLALEACRHELESTAMLVSDRALSLSMARVVNSDARAIAKAQASEEQAARDREFALRLSRDPHAEPTPAEDNSREGEWPAEGVDDAWIEAFKSMNLVMPTVADDDVDEDTGHAESSRWGSTREQPIDRECIACGDRFPSISLSRSPCSHEYCRECLLAYAKLSSATFAANVGRLALAHNGKRSA